MTTIKTAKKYSELRRKNPFLSASTALTIAKSADKSEGWEESSDNQWTQEVDGLTITLNTEDESIYPVPDGHGVTDYGTYIDEGGSEDYEWNGNWPRPNELPPLGFPYTSIRYSGPGWTQGLRSGYFIPEGIVDHYEWLRSNGQSRSVSWDMTKEFIEEQLSTLFSSPLTNTFITVTASKKGIVLASTSIGTDISGDDEGRAYIFELVDECGMVTEVVDDAKAAIAELAKVN